MGVRGDAPAPPSQQGQDRRERDRRKGEEIGCKENFRMRMEDVEWKRGRMRKEDGEDVWEEGRVRR